MAEAISSQLEFDDLLNVVLQALARVVNYDSANVQLLQQDRLVIIGGRGWEDSKKVLGLSRKGFFGLSLPQHAWPCHGGFTKQNRH